MSSAVASFITARGYTRRTLSHSQAGLNILQGACEGTSQNIQCPMGYLHTLLLPNERDKRSHLNGRAGGDNFSESDMLNRRSENSFRHDCRRLTSHWWIISMWGVVILTACRVAILHLGKSIVSGGRAKDVGRSATGEGLLITQNHLDKQ